MGAEVDSIELKIESDAKQANAELDKLISKLSLVSQKLSSITGNKSMQDMVDKTKIVDANFRQISNSAKKTAESVSKPMTQAIENVEQRTNSLREKYKDLGKGIQLSGSFESLRKQLSVYENSLARAQLRVQREGIKNPYSKAYEDAIADSQQYSNMIKSIKEQLQSSSNITPFQGVKESTRNIKAELTSVSELISRFDKTIESGLFEKINIRPFEDTMRTNITKELEESLARLQNFNLSSTNEEFETWKSTIDDIKSALDYVNENSKNPKNIVSGNETGGNYNQEAQKFVEDYAAGLDKVKQKTNDVNAEIQKMISAFKPTELKIGEAYSKEFLEIQKDIQKTEKELSKLYERREQNQRLGLNPNTQVNRRLADNIEQAEKRLQEYRREMVFLQREGGDVIKTQTSGFQEMADSISNTGSVLSKFASVFRAIGMTDIASPLQKWSQVAKQASSSVNEIGQKAQTAGATASTAMGKASASASGFFSKIAAGASKFGYVGIAIAAVIVAIAMRVKVLKAELKLVKNGVTALAKGFTSLWSIVGRVGKSILTIGSSSYQAITPVGKMINKIINTFKSRVLRQAITKALQYVTEGFEKLNEYSKSIGSDFHGNMSLIYSDLKLLGRTIATAFEPLINVVAPILDFIIRKVIDLINVINQALAAITGASTWTKATYAMEEWGEAATKAGGSAKKASKQLASMQEINNLTTNEPGGGGGGGGANAIAIEDMFDTLPVNEKIKKYIEKIKEAWRTNADFTFIGSDIANIASNLLEKIDWLSIIANFRKGGKAIATIINGFTEFPHMGERIGSNIGMAINTAIAGIDGFIKNINFNSIGSFIGNAIGRAIDTIHWSEYLSDMSSLGEGLADGINSLANTGIMSKIAVATANILKGGISLAYKFVTTTDFINLGRRFADSITSFMETMNEIDPSTGLTSFQELGKGITELSHGFAEFIVNAVRNIDSEEVKKGFKDFFESLDFTSILLDCAIIIDQIELGLLSLIWDGIQGVFSGNSDSLADDIKASLGDTLQKGIDGAINILTLPANWVYNNVLKKGWENIRISSDFVVEKVGDAIKTGISNIKISTNWVYENILKKGWENIQISFDWIVQFVGNAISTGIENIQLSANWVYENILKTGWENIQLSSDWLVSSVTGAFDTAFSKLKEKWNEIVYWWDNNKPSLSDFAINVKSPHIAITWDTTSAAATAMQKMFKLKGMPKFDVQYYAQGGFPEDGWFRASQGEIMGQFDNGKSVVANNEQITEGISRAVQAGNAENNALMRQEIELLKAQNQYLSTLASKEFGISQNELFRSVQGSANDYYNRTGNPAFAI